MELGHALELALDGHALLFIGAGYSVGAVNKKGRTLKTGTELARYLSELTDLPEITSLEDAAEEFTGLYGENDLVNIIKEEFTASEVTSSQLQIAKIPWRRIYTTNYDNVFEESCLRLNRTCRPMTISSRVRLRGNIALSEYECIHLNGFVESLDSEKIGSELKLTDTSYLTASVSGSSLAKLFRQDLSLARAVFFIGYSLTDLDIRRLLHDSQDLLEKCFFVIGEHPADATYRRAARFGTIIPTDTTGFADLLSSKQDSYSPQIPEAHIGYSIRKFTVPESQRTFSDQAIFDLLLLGQLRPDLIWSSLHEGEPYIYERPKAQETIDLLSSGSRIVMVHSELGNGKTCFLESIKCKALEMGYGVYTVSVRSTDIFRELDQIFTSTEKTILMIEEYSDWLDVVEYFSLNANSNISLILSARNPVHDIMIDDVCQIMGTSNIPEISVDLLTENDLTWLIEFFNTYGLWGERAAWSPDRKLRHLKRSCHSQFSSILMNLFESPQIARRFERILNSLTRKRDYYEILMSVMILAVVQKTSSIDLMIDIWGDTIMESQFKRNETVREFFDFPTGEIRLRSATAAQFILKHVADANITTDTLIRMARVFNEGARFSDYHRRLLRDLMRFSTLQMLLPENQRTPAIIRYYEGIKNLDRCRTNPQFWLQYAIACLTLEELDQTGTYLGRAETYFHTAYSYASDVDYNTFQIDNHYGRFLLIKATRTGDPDTCMGPFRQARAIIENQIKAERLHYPYRVARSYRSFYEVFESKVEELRLTEIYEAAVFVLRRIQTLPATQRYHRNVEDCMNDMNAIVSRYEGRVGEKQQ